MSLWLIGVVTVAYALASLSLFYEGKLGLGLFALGCVIANLGLMISARG